MFNCSDLHRLTDLLYRRIFFSESYETKKINQQLEHYISNENI